MLYHYVAQDRAGKLVESDLDADTLGNVLHYLAAQELRPVSIDAAKDDRKVLFQGKIKLEDKVFLTKYLSLMLRVGTDLLSAINILISDFDKPAVKNFLVEVRDNLMGGRPFYQAFEIHTESFSLEMVNLIKAAEESGNLQKTFEDLSETLTSEAELRSKVKAAMIYPIILLCMSVLIVGFLVMFALPKIAKVFLESGIKPPPFSAVVFGIGLFINDHIVGIIIALVIILGPGGYFFFQNKYGRLITGRITFKLPLIKGVIKELAIQRFAATFSSLMRAGMPIIKALKITAEVVGSEEVKVSLNRIADEGLAKGLTIGEAFKKETVFPSVVTNLVAISEKGGHLEDVLDTLAKFYASSVESKIKGLVSVIEPLMLLVMGILVATIALSIVIPIYQLTTQF